MPSNSYLLTGGTGNTSLKIARLLKDAGDDVLIASRKGSDVPAPYTGVKFDWYDKSTYTNAFDLQKHIDGIYLVQPPFRLDVFQYMQPFIDIAIANGVKRFVLLSSCRLVEGHPLEIRKVHEYIASKNLEWCVLRPGFFFENWANFKAPTILQSDALFSCTGNRKLAPIASDDIADAAFHGLVDQPAPNNDPILMGPELLSYDEIAEKLSTVLGRQIRHINISPEEFTNLLVNAGVSEEYSKMLTQLDVDVFDGMEEEQYGLPDTVKGTRYIGEFFEKHKQVWAK